MFAADGELVGAPTCQSVVDAQDQRLLSPAGSTTDEIYATPAGRLAVLLGEDLFSGRRDEGLSQAKVDVIAAPQALLQPDVWDAPWPEAARYTVSSGGASHWDLTRSQAATTLGLPVRLRATGAQAGAVAYLRGRLWGQGTDGQSLAAKGDLIESAPRVDGPVLLNLWLGNEPKPEPAPAPVVDPLAEPELPGLTWPGRTPPKKKKAKKKGTRRRGGGS